jgi:hypothetical protein
MWPFGHEAPPTPPPTDQPLVIPDDEQPEERLPAQPEVDHDEEELN